MSSHPLVVAASLIERFSAALWIGGTVALGGLVAPLLFKRLPSRSLAGEVFGEVLARFEIVRYFLSALLVLALFLRAEAGTATEPMVLRALLVAGLASVSVYSGMVLAVKIHYFRSKIESLETVSADDPWKQKLDTHHRRAVRLMMLGLVLACALLALPEPQAAR